MQLCLTHYDPCNLPGFSVHGLFQARILEWIAISFSRVIYPTQGSNLGPPALQKYVISILIVFFFFLFWLHCKTSEILISQLVIEPSPSASEQASGILTTGPPGNSLQFIVYALNFITWGTS